MRYWLLAISCWLLAVGCGTLGTGERFTPFHMLIGMFLYEVSVGYFCSSKCPCR